MQIANCARLPSHTARARRLRACLYDGVCAGVLAPGQPEPQTAVAGSTRGSAAGLYAGVCPRSTRALHPGCGLYAGVGCRALRQGVPRVGSSLRRRLRASRGGRLAG